ncbi:MAG: nucleoside-diphosphate kinase [bacterium]|nr:nucleoside-diphosphate kinase [bacterium]
MIKPDGVQRGLIGEVISRFERVGLKIVAMKMVHPQLEDVDKHYALTEEWMQGVYNKAKTKYDAEGKAFPFADHISYGNNIKKGLVDFLMSAPVVAIVLEGEMAIPLIRKLVGSTEPSGAPAGTIRGDLSHDSYALSNTQNRPLRNIIHASGTEEEAKNEIAIWFTDVELHEYEHVNDRVQYDANWFLPTEK